MITYRKATIDDIPILLNLRMKLLSSVNGKGENETWEIVEEQVVQYYREALSTEEHIAYLAFDGDRCIATGGICFYRVLPTYHNPNGKKSYVINMYTEPEYRRKGIATKILDFLIDDSERKEAYYISLEATNEGRPVYEKYGFGLLKSEMQYKNETYED